MADPKFEVDEPVTVIGDEQMFSGTVLGIQFNVPTWWYIIKLDDPIESDYGLQKGLFVPEACLEECQEEDSEPAILENEWTTIGSYVYTCNQEGFPDAIDVEVRLVHDDQGNVYVQTLDEIDGTLLWDITPYKTQAEAEAIAREVIANSHEAEPGENAATYLKRIRDT